MRTGATLIRAVPLRISGGQGNHHILWVKQFYRLARELWQSKEYSHGKTGGYNGQTSKNVA